MPLREATLPDAAAIARVHVASWQSAYRELIPASRLATFTVPARTAAWRHTLTHRSGSMTIVFDDDDGIAGFASIGGSRELPGWGEIYALYVDPDRWGRGVGSALFAASIATFAARGITRVLLWVLEGNQRALQFYQGSGFLLDGSRKVEDGLPQVRLKRAR